MSVLFWNGLRSSQHQDTHAPPLVVGFEYIPARVGHGLLDRSGQAEVPNKIVMGYQVRQDLREPMITLLAAFMGTVSLTRVLSAERTSQAPSSSRRIIPWANLGVF